MITNVSGSFGDFDISATTSGDDFSTAQFNFSAVVDSISTGVTDRDAHLKSDDFFNAEQYPVLSFKSTDVTKKDEDNYTITGDMTIRDVTKKVQFDAEFGGIVQDPYGQTKAGLTLNGKLKRSEYGLKWSAVTEAGSIVVSDDIKLHGEVQLVKQA